MKKLISLLLLSSVGTLSGAAHAQSRDTVTVSLPVSGAAESDRQFRHRIADSVEEVCGSYAAVEHDQWREIDQCRKVAWANVERQLAELKATGSERLATK